MLIELNDNWENCRIVITFIINITFENIISSSGLWHIFFIHIYANFKILVGSTLNKEGKDLILLERYKCVYYIIIYKIATKTIDFREQGSSQIWLDQNIVLHMKVCYMQKAM